MNRTHPAFRDILELIGQRTGLSFVRGEANAELGVRRAMAGARIDDLDVYAEHLKRDEAIFDDLVSEMTVGETYFFREPAQFRFIEEEILPDIERRRGLARMRAWCAGCASGEEAYSLAMVLAEHGNSEQAHLVATDISRTALARAREAVYGEWSLRGESAARAKPYLHAAGKTFRLADSIRRRVTLSHLNLALNAYPSFAAGIWGMDLILCRNVLIYFDKETVAQVARRLFNSLTPGGWLITASSDPPLWDEAGFQVITHEDGIFYRRPSVEASMEPVFQGVQGLGPSLTDSFKRPAGHPLVMSEPVPAPTMNVLDGARQALARGDCARVVQLTGDFGDDANLAALHVRALANLDVQEAERACTQAASRCRFSAELNYLHAVLLLEMRQWEAAAQAMRRALYLDRKLAVAHFTLGSILRQCGDQAGARRAYRNARDLCAERPADETLPLADGESAGRLAEAAAAELNLLERTALA